MTDDLSLAADFPPARREDWLKLVTAALRGKPFETLVARSYDDLAIGPLYGRAADAQRAGRAATAAAWQVMQRVDHPDPVAANAEALHDLENGATGLALVFAGAVGAYGFGLSPSEATLTRVLDGVLLDAAAIELDLGHAWDAAAQAAELVK